MAVRGPKRTGGSGVTARSKSLAKATNGWLILSTEIRRADEAEVLAASAYLCFVGRLLNLLAEADEVVRKGIDEMISGCPKKGASPAV